MGASDGGSNMGRRQPDNAVMFAGQRLRLMWGGSLSQISILSSHVDFWEIISDPKFKITKNVCSKGFPHIGKDVMGGVGTKPYFTGLTRLYMYIASNKLC